MKRRFHRAGFSLVEVALAIGVASFCLLAICGLLPVGVDSTRDSHHHTAAATLATMIVSDLRSTPLATATSPFYAISVPGQTTLYLNEDGSKIGSPTAGDGGPVYRATLTVTSPSGSTPREATTASIQITWNARAATPNPTEFYQTVVGLDRN